MTYVVKFINLTENTLNRFEYDNLFDALKVCKETNLSDHYHLPAMSEKFFNEHLLELLTSAVVYVGTKTEKHPAGEIMIMLTMGENRSVYSALPMPFIPGQILPVAEDFSPEVVQALYTKQSKDS
ncbi:hypothetical protein [Streptomyces rochei]|uniref:hypothetical protein n=1 Tax=Streptomyces rochei TaxID=1928 RepID=UPI0036867BC9